MMQKSFFFLSNNWPISFNCRIRIKHILSSLSTQRQIWIVKFFIKNPLEILSKEKKTGVSRKIVCFGILIHVLS